MQQEIQDHLIETLLTNAQEYEEEVEEVLREVAAAGGQVTNWWPHEWGITVQYRNEREEEK